MEFEKIADILKALADPTRLKILSLLRIRDCCVCELVPIFNISQPAISKHVSRLKTAELVRETRKGQWVFYSINEKRLEEIGYALSHLPDLSEESREIGATRTDSYMRVKGYAASEQTREKAAFVSGPLFDVMDFCCDGVGDWPGLRIS
ncbi:metalloregulator ArsR/SmtB family transcription factor [Paenibacillus sp. P26]|nr:metalloregulator ArsR/SmtB family transcription factor [Paenibacillus sp. P26]